jgi:hypothetical protein
MKAVKKPTIGEHGEAGPTEAEVGEKREELLNFSLTLSHRLQ